MKLLVEFPEIVLAKFRAARTTTAVAFLAEFAVPKIVGAAPSASITNGIFIEGDFLGLMG